MNPIIHPDAQADPYAQAEYIARDNVEAGLRLIDPAQRAYDLLQLMPGIGSPCAFKHPKLQGVRRHVLKGFPNHLVYFKVIEGRVHILRLLHAAQDQKQHLLKGR